MKNRFDVIIIGGGAAGFFTAINISEINPNLKIAILERGQEVLTKVKISGGGRCNVTHAEFIPIELSKNYPRGEKELIGPFHTFMTGDTIEWFEDRGVPLKIEEDGRMFPVSDTSQSIIDCFIKEIKRLEISLMKKTSVQNIIKENNDWFLETNNGVFRAKKIVMATGSNPKIWNLLKKLGHTIIPPVPSLFTFNIDDNRINDLPGIATKATVTVLNKKIIESQGDLLITHLGLSGPAILKLSAWNAIALNKLDYSFTIKINWLLAMNYEDVIIQLKQMNKTHAKQTIHKYTQFELPKRLWQNLLIASGIQKTQKWAELSKLQMQELANQLIAGEFQVLGKSTFKEEFVTAGGVDLKEINFKKFNSKIHPELYFAGEVLNIDAITGGFNFQNAWTGGFIVAKSI